MKEKRYLEKLESFEGEIDFIGSHTICDDVSERALLHSLQICVEISTDIIAMIAHDFGLVVKDDYTNIENLTKEGIIGFEDSQVLKSYNGLRNSIVHRYGNIDLDIVEEGLDDIDKLYEIVVKIVEKHEKQNHA